VFSSQARKTRILFASADLALTALAFQAAFATRLALDRFWFSASSPGWRRAGGWMFTPVWAAGDGASFCGMRSGRRWSAR
jgi:hypothetical protein